MPFKILGSEDATLLGKTRQSPKAKTVTATAKLSFDRGLKFNARIHSMHFAMSMCELEEAIAQSSARARALKGAQK